MRRRRGRIEPVVPGVAGNDFLRRRGSGQVGPAKPLAPLLSQGIGTQGFRRCASVRRRRSAGALFFHCFELVSMDNPDILFANIEGIFYRAVDPAYRAYALAGSRSAGRYSEITQPTLYLSASREGVDAAMHAHQGNRSPHLEVVSVRVVADRIVDLRNPAALSAIGISLDDAIAPWQDIVAAGGSPRSWAVRRRLESCGAQGLIDPSRKAPGLWHLVLFAWNQPGAPQVAVID